MHSKALLKTCLPAAELNLPEICSRHIQQVCNCVQGQMRQSSIPEALILSSNMLPLGRSTYTREYFLFVTLRNRKTLVLSVTHMLSQQKALFSYVLLRFLLCSYQNIMQMENEEDT